NLAIFVFLVLTFRRRKYYGEHFLKYMALYSLGRFFIEGLRTDSLMFFGFRTAQLISILFIAIVIVLYVVISRKQSSRILPRRDIK
ncbi:MAG: prolipoprotein diacylglyceryl transferase, partial [Bacillota bacterium]|nr:prolipoprotein diacylglyceryl transferase [Bacillota bacterium]